MRLSSDRREKRARVASPTAILTFVIGNQGSGKLLDVVAAVDLREQIPFHRTFVEGIEHDIAALRPVEAPHIAAVRIGDHGAIAARQSARHDFLDRRALARAGRADQLEVLGLVLRRTAVPATVIRVPESRRAILARNALRARGGGPSASVATRHVRSVMVSVVRRCQPSRSGAAGRPGSRSGAHCRPRRPVAANRDGDAPTCRARCTASAMPPAAVTVNGTAMSGDKM